MKRIKGLFLTAALLTAMPAIAHDEGHGPKVAESGKFGGMLAAIVDKKDANLGAKAKLHYKAELVRSPDGKVQIYVYDSELKPVDLASWSKTVSVTAAPHKKGQKAKSFEATFDGKSFVGQIPDGLAKPYNLDFVFKAKSRELLSAFDNLD